MKKHGVFSLIAMAVLLALLFPRAAAADSFPEVIPLPVGWQAEGIAIGAGDTFYAGSLATGAVYSGSLSTGEGGVLVPPQGVQTVGLSFDHRSGYLFAAGGGSGRGAVFDTSDGSTVATFQFTTDSPTFINDVIVTRDAAYFTNSLRPEFYRVPLGPGGSVPASDTFETISLGGEWAQVPGFNANGIEAAPNGKRLLIINSASGILYRVNPASGEALAVDTGGYLLTNGDGILLHKKILYVVRNRLNLIAAIHLSPDYLSGEVVEEITNPNFAVPTTVGRFGNALYAVNAHFGSPDPTTQTYEVVRVELD